MPPRRAAAPPPLTDDQVAHLRAEVAAGRNPRVVVRTPSAGLAAGTRGSVLRVDDPAASSECVVVRLGGDEIPFAPAELALPAPAARRLAAVSGGPAETAGPAAGSAAAVTPRPARRAARSREKAPPSRTAAASPTEPPLPPAAPAPPATATARRGGRGAARRKPPAPVTLTLRFADGAWTAEAARGGKRVGGRSVPVRPGAVAALAELIDDPQVGGLIGETVAACRSEVEERAARLRDELAVTEAALREYER